MVLKQLVETTDDATLDELRYQLEQQTSVLIGRSTVDRADQAKQPSKKHSTLRKREWAECNNNASSSGNWCKGGWHSYLIFIDESGINLA